MGYQRVRGASNEVASQQMLQQHQALAPQAMNISQSNKFFDLNKVLGAPVNSTNNRVPVQSKRPAQIKFTNTQQV